MPGEHVLWSDAAEGTVQANVIEDGTRKADDVPNLQIARQNEAARAADAAAWVLSAFLIFPIR